MPVNQNGALAQEADRKTKHLTNDITNKGTGRRLNKEQKTRRNVSSASQTQRSGADSFHLVFAVFKGAACD